MNDFLRQMRSGNAKRFDKGRKPYENPQYRGTDRQSARERRVGSPKKNLDQNQLFSIKKILESIAEEQKSLAELAKRQTAAMERMAAALEHPRSIISAGEAAEPADVSAPAAPSGDSPAEPVMEPVETGDKTHRNALVETILRMRKKGASFDDIARHLIAEQIPTLTGKGEWRAQSVSRIWNQCAEERRRTG